MRENVILIGQKTFVNRPFFCENIKRLFPNTDEIEFMVPLHSKLFFMLRNRQTNYNFKQFILENNEDFSFFKMASRIVIFTDLIDKEMIHFENLARNESLDITIIPVEVKDFSDTFDNALAKDIETISLNDEIFREIQQQEELMNLAADNLNWEIAAKFRDRIRILKTKL